MVRQLSLGAAFRNMGYKPHDIQRQVHLARADHRFRTVCAGRRTGKSNLGGRELAFEAMRARTRQGLSKTGRRAEFWIVGPEYSDAEKEFRVMWDSLLKMGAESAMDKPGTYYNPEAGQMDLSMFGGKFQVHAKSAKYPNTLVGEALEGVILAEAAKLKPTVWTKFIRPMLSDYHGWALLTSTPEGKNWFYEQWQRGQDENDPNWWSVRAPSWSNNRLFPLGITDPEILDMAKDMSEEKFKQEIGAEFTEFVGRVYKDFDEETHVKTLEYDPKLPLYVATDWGYTNPNVVLFIQVNVWGDVFVIDEYYRNQRNPDELILDLQDHPRYAPLLRAATLMYPDPEDPASASLMADKFHLKIQGNTGGLLQTRINLIRRWLRAQPLELEDGHPDKIPKLFFDRKCNNTIANMQDYRYPENKSEVTESKENPLKVDDHGPEALSRFFGGYFHEEKPKRRARVSTASMSHGR